jgi:2-polyprenyl-3-methyl-5-hydroxy-6-metoxy-1,4-benzoquinol methylase
LVNAHFEAASDFWTDIYDRDDVVGLICQRRHDLTLEWINELALPLDAKVLEVGCGAGLTAVELARRGFIVDATDTVPEMIELSRRHAAEANVSGRVLAALDDAHDLHFAAETFDLVVALGVIPWLHSAQTALLEMARVLKPGAHIVVTANNGARLTYFLDPKYNLAMRPIREGYKYILRRLGVLLPRGGAPSQTHSLRGFQSLLSAANLRTTKACSLGFGPFTLLGHRLLPPRHEVRVHAWLQRAADRGVPGIRALGAQHVVLAQKVSGLAYTRDSA